HVAVLDGDGALVRRVAGELRGGVQVDREGAAAAVALSAGDGIAVDDLAEGSAGRRRLGLPLQLPVEGSVRVPVDGQLVGVGIQRVGAGAPGAGIRRAALRL